MPGSGVFLGGWKRPGPPHFSCFEVLVLPVANGSFTLPLVALAVPGVSAPVGAEFTDRPVVPAGVPVDKVPPEVPSAVPGDAFRADSTPGGAEP